jgi:phosphate transport system permease protein
MTLEHTQEPPALQESVYPRGEAFKRQLAGRNLRAGLWKRFFAMANVVALIALIVIFLNVINQTFGYTIMRYTVPPGELSERPLTELTGVELGVILGEQLGNRTRVAVRDTLSRVPNNEFTTRPLREVLAGLTYPPEVAELTINDLTPEQITTILSDNLSQGQMLELINDMVVEPLVIRSFLLSQSLFEREEIDRIHREEYPDDYVEFRSWISLDFITSPIASDATTAGLRTALLGSLWILGITVGVAFPLGVGAAIYLEEYADRRSWLNRLIETNVRNLAGVPSIIYGMLGLAVFVRALGDITSGAFVGVTDSNGRTVLSAGLTMALLILPVLIINAQEAIRAVPSSIREASFGLGATKWQTVWKQVLPAAVPGILTGVILAMSRAIGETAPLIVVGASTFIGVDPNGPFSKFTVVPIQIYQWTSRAELVFKNTAAAAIIVLLVLLLTLNATAIILRQYYRRKLQG